MFSIALHAGSETITKDELTPEKDKQYKEALEKALNAGYELLAQGGSAVEAVERTVMALEDNELFNAGKGAVFTADEEHELEAAIMNGKTLEAGSVAGLRSIRNPISLARTVMEKSKYVMLIGDGAEDFAREHQIAMVPNSYFSTDFRFQELKETREEEKENSKAGLGTVGCVALDQAGNLAAATSTGGLTNSEYRRVGDSPIIGGGTYANNQMCAVSCTGTGEMFIRNIVAHDVACLVAYKGLSLRDACHELVFNKLKPMGGEGGLIAVDPSGTVELVFNTEGMYRAWRNERGEGDVAIF